MLQSSYNGYLLFERGILRTSNQNEMNFVNTYMLFAVQEVLIGKNCARGLE